ncbi:MAG TPA: VCBS repeat-containing protein [Ktedonobacteraceae bacterium]
MRTKYGGSLLMRGLLILGMPFYSPIIMGRAAESPSSFTSTTYAVGANPTGIVFGDFNGDGKTDIVTTNSTDSSISILMGNGDGTFRSSQAFPIGAAPTGVAVGDFKKDGKLDIVTTNSSDNSISVLMGNGDGTFQSPQTLLVGADPIGVAVGDFKRDGKLDIVTTNSSDNSVSLLMGNGNGTFQLPQTLHVGANPTRIVVGNVNGNGNLAIATINSNDNSISVLVGKSDSSTSSRQPSTENAQPQQSPVGRSGYEGVQAQASPVGSSGTEGVQPPQASPVGNSADAMTIGISGPLSASVSWRSGTDSTEIATSHSMLRHVLVAFTDADMDNQKSDCQVIIDWGDGTKVKEVIAKKFLTKNFLISSQHVYRKSGSFQATLTIRDSDGLALTTTQTMAIASR